MMAPLHNIRSIAEAETDRLKRKAIASGVQTAIYLVCGVLFLIALIFADLALVVWLTPEIGLGWAWLAGAGALILLAFLLMIFSGLLSGKRKIRKAEREAAQARERLKGDAAAMGIMAASMASRLDPTQPGRGKWLALAGLMGGLIAGGLIGRRKKS